MSLGFWAEMLEIGIERLARWELKLRLGAVGIPGWSGGKVGKDLTPRASPLAQDDRVALGSCSMAKRVLKLAFSLSLPQARGLSWQDLFVAVNSAAETPSEPLSPLHLPPYP